MPAEPQAAPAEPEGATGAPSWLMPVITRSMWRAVLIVLVVLAALWALNQARDLVVMGIVACFLALAILPAVDGMVRRHNVSRGLATMLVMLGVFLAVALLIGFLVPALVDVFSKVSAEVPRWLTDVRKLGLPIPLLKESDAELMASFQNWLRETGGHQALSIAGSGVGLLAKVFVTFIFTIIIASGEPAILRTILSRLQPANQVRLVDAWETAIEQTGGYFYSRLLLMFFTSTGYLIVMLLVGMPWLFAIPLAVFGAFFVEFIPLVGGYIGIAIPVLFVLVEKGPVRALILLGWAIVYQQIHDYLLSPRISSKTMTLSPGIALGSALVGGAIAGPLGALFAMPTAGMVTAFLTKYLPSQPIVVSAKSLAVPHAGRERGDKPDKPDKPDNSEPDPTDPPKPAADPKGP